MDQLGVSVPHKYHICVWRLPERICAWSHQAVGLEPMCDVMGAPCPHVFLQFVFVLAVSRMATVLFDRPDRFLALARHLVLYATVIGMVGALFLVVFLSCPCCSHNTAYRFGCPAKNSLAVTTLVIATAGPLRTITLGCCWISSRSFRDS